MDLKTANTPGRVLVTGATGNIGSVVLATLAEQEVDVIAGLSGNDRQAGIPPGMSWRVCDFQDEEKLAQALHGVDSVFLLVPFAEHMVAWGRQFVRAASSAGVRFVLRLSGLAAAIDSESAIGRLHGQIDEAVRESGVPYCVLRANAFMQNFSGLYGGMMRRTGALFLPEDDARLNFIDTRDIGIAAATIMMRPQAHKGRTYDLDGPEALGNEDTVRIISEVAGTRFEYRPISAAQANASYRELGICDWKIEVLDSLEAFIRDGNAARQSAEIGDLMGRPPTKFEDFARDYRNFWTPNNVKDIDKASE